MSDYPTTSAGKAPNVPHTMSVLPLSPAGLRALLLQLFIIMIAFAGAPAAARCGNTCRNRSQKPLLETAAPDAGLPFSASPPAICGVIMDVCIILSRARRLAAPRRGPGRAVVLASAYFCGLFVPLADVFAAVRSPRSYYKYRFMLFMVRVLPKRPGHVCVLPYNDSLLRRFPLVPRGFPARASSF